MFAAFLTSWRLLTMEILVKSLPLFAMAGFAIMLLRRSAASSRSLVWRLTLAGLLTLPVLSLLLPSLQVSPEFLARPAPAPQIRPVQPVITARADASSKPNALTAGPAAPTATALNKPAPAEPSALSGQGASTAVGAVTPPTQPDVWAVLRNAAKTQSLPLFFSLWLATLVLLQSRILIGLRALRRLQYRALSVDATLQTTMAALVQEAGVSRSVRFYIALPDQRGIAPMTWGLFNPIILLPAEAQNWSSERLRAVLLHEGAHIARHDWALQLLADFACAVYWFHPLVWLLARQLRQESEQACDDHVLSCGLNAPDYAAHLLEIVKMRKSTVPLPSGAVSMAHASMLETRLRALLDPGRSRRQMPRSVALWALVGFAALLLPLAAARVVARQAPLVPVVAIAAPTSTALFPSETEGSASLPISTSPSPGLLAARQPSFDLASNREALEMPGSTIQWGKAVRGLQAGLQLASGPNVVLGQCIALRCWLRNTGKKALTLRYPALPDQPSGNPVDNKDIFIRFQDVAPAQPPANPFLWSATVTNGEKITLLREPTSIDAHKLTTLVLNPGEERVLPGGETKFLTAPLGNTTNGEQTIILTPGRRTIQAAPFLYAKSGDAWIRSLSTGTLTLDVSALPSNTTEPRPSNSIAVALKGDDAKRGAFDMKGIQWGPVVIGLQAGIRIEGDKRSFTEGDKIDLTSYIRNTTDHKIAFVYTYNSSRVWDTDGAAIPKYPDPSMAAGLPGATLLIIPPGETIVHNYEHLTLGAANGEQSTSQLLRLQAGKYHVAQPFLYGIPGQDHPGIGATEPKAEAASLKEAQKILDKRDPIYKTSATLLTREGKTYKARAVTVAAYSYMNWNHLEGSPTPRLDALKDAFDMLWTGLAEFEVMAKPAEKGVVNLKGVQWGVVKDGLQAGLRIPGDKKRFNPGERVPLDCYLRNTTDHEIAFTYTARVFQIDGELPEVHDVAHPATAKAVHGVLLFGLDAALSLLLKPGEAVVFPHVGLGLGENQVKDPNPRLQEKGLEQFPYLEDPAPGTYTLRQTFRYNIMTSEKVKELADKSHRKDAVIIEPMSVTLIRPDGKTYPGEVTVIPFYSENSMLATGDVRFEIFVKAAASEKPKGVDEYYSSGNRFQIPAKVAKK